MNLLGIYPEASGLAPRIAPTGKRSLNEEAVAKSGGNFIITLDQIQQLILEQSLDATEILVNDEEVWHRLFFNSPILEDFNSASMVSNGNA
jgi:hypothetical protein